MPFFFLIPFLSKSPFVRLKCIISVQAFALSPLLFPNKWSQPHLFNQTWTAADVQRVVFEHKNSKNQKRLPDRRAKCRERETQCNFICKERQTIPIKPVIDSVRLWLSGCAKEQGGGRKVKKHALRIRVWQKVSDSVRGATGGYMEISNWPFGNAATRRDWKWEVLLSWG